MALQRDYPKIFDEEADRNLGKFDFAARARQPKYCQYGQEFAEWWTEQFRATEEAAQSTDDPNKVFNQAKVMLLEGYMERYQFAPKSHRNCLGSKRHICLHQVFIDACMQLKAAQLARVGPVLPGRPQRQLRVPAMFLGEVE